MNEVEEAGARDRPLVKWEKRVKGWEGRERVCDG